MFEIKKEIAEKYNMDTLDYYLGAYGDTIQTRITYLETFLFQTQDIESQAMACMLSGESIPENVQEIVELKKQVRIELENLKSEV